MVLLLNRICVLLAMLTLIVYPCLFQNCGGSWELATLVELDLYINRLYYISFPERCWRTRWVLQASSFQVYNYRDEYLEFKICIISYIIIPCMVGCEIPPWKVWNWVWVLLPTSTGGSLQEIIPGMRWMFYQERLNSLSLYSLESGRMRNDLIQTWQSRCWGALTGGTKGLSCKMRDQSFKAVHFMKILPYGYWISGNLGPCGWWKAKHEMYSRWRKINVWRSRIDGCEELVGFKLA